MLTVKEAAARKLLAAVGVDADQVVSMSLGKLNARIGRLNELQTEENFVPPEADDDKALLESITRAVAEGEDVEIDVGEGNGQPAAKKPTKAKGAKKPAAKKPAKVDKTKPTKPAKAEGESKPRQLRKVTPAEKPGTLLKGKYKGTEYQATVRKDGYEYEGEMFSSLSTIGRRITGCEVNGPKFFGLR